ncbi:hypothetical protein [Saccharopolyspora taberi]|uniref:Uncharacterized protein n=1 Tax=Saccharopolyspora taberi TaxID=60895 RepID=A0ABN3VQ94_9PSEU
MPDYEVSPQDDPAERLTEQITAQIDAHLRERVRRIDQQPPAGTGDSHIHLMTRHHTTIITGTVYTHTINTGGGADADDPAVAQLQRVLRQVLQRLPEAGLSRRAERAVRRRVVEAMEASSQIQDPQPAHRLRSLVGQVSTALVTGIASGGANPLAGELLKLLQHAVV